MSDSMTSTLNCKFTSCCVKLLSWELRLGQWVVGWEPERNARTKVRFFACSVVLRKQLDLLVSFRFLYPYPKPKGRRRSTKSDEHTFATGLPYSQCSISKNGWFARLWKNLQLLSHADITLLVRPAPSPLHVMDSNSGYCHWNLQRNFCKSFALF